MSNVVQNTDDIFYIPRLHNSPVEPRSKLWLITNIVVCVLGILVTCLFATGYLMPVSSPGAISAMVIGSVFSVVSFVVGILGPLLECCENCNSSTREPSQQDPVAPLPTDEEGPGELFNEGNDAADVHMNLLNNYLSVQELGVLSQVNKFNAQVFQSAIVIKAQKYGYEGNNQEGAKQHLHGLFLEIRDLQSLEFFNINLRAETIALGLHKCTRQKLLQLLKLVAQGQDCPLLVRYLTKLVDHQAVALGKTPLLDHERVLKHGLTITHPSLVEMIDRVILMKDTELLTLFFKICNTTDSEYLTKYILSRLLFCLPAFSFDMIECIIKYAHAKQIELNNCAINDYKGIDRCSFLMTALLSDKIAMNDRQKLAKLFLENGASPHVPLNRKGNKQNVKSPLQLAQEYGWHDIVALMKEKGATA